MANEEEATGCHKKTPCYRWWNVPERSGYEKKLALLVLLLLVVCISLIIVIAVTNHKINLPEPICHTKECVDAASYMMSKIDTSLDPCEDFYEYSCGNYKRKRVPQADEFGVSSMGDMQNDIYIELRKQLEKPVETDDSEVTVKIKNLYNSCINSSTEDGNVDELLKLLVRVGRWPIIDPEWGDREPDLERRMAILFVHGIFSFIEPSVTEEYDEDEVEEEEEEEEGEGENKNEEGEGESKNEEGEGENKNDEDDEPGFFLKMAPGSLIMQTPVYLDESDEDYVEYMDSYKELITETAGLLNADEATIQKDVEEIVEFEREYARITTEEQSWQERLADLNETDDLEPRPYNIHELKKLVPEIQWSEFFDYIFEYFNVYLHKRDVAFWVERKEHFRNLAILFTKTPKRVVANYLTWRFVYKLMPYLGVNFRRLYDDFSEETPRLNPSSTRWKQCISIMEKQFVMPLTALFIKDNFNSRQKDEILEVISAMKQQYKTSMRNQDWLDDDSKTICEIKVENMKVKMAFPRYITKPEELSEDFSEIKIKKGRFLQNILQVKRNKIANSLYTLTGRTEKEEYYLDEPLTVNAFYLPDENKMVFPLGQLLTPFFETNRPNYLNYAGLGETVSHEITHAFDTDSILTTRLSGKKMLKRYAENAMCFADQYSKLPLGVKGKKVNGMKTINDNLCDNASLKNSYKAYLAYVSKHGEEPALPGVPYTISQVFFLKYAQGWCELASEELAKSYMYDEHSPPKHRANVPMSNFDEFSKAFNCPKGSPMNPEEKCHMWG